MSNHTLNINTILHTKDGSKIGNAIVTGRVTVDDFYNEEKTLIVHNYINMKGKMVLNKEEASLLLLELYKFVNS